MLKTIASLAAGYVLYHCANTSHGRQMVKDTWDFMMRQSSEAEKALLTSIRKLVPVKETPEAEAKTESVDPTTYPASQIGE